jgi:hypothetical protein
MSNSLATHPEIARNHSSKNDQAKQDLVMVAPSGAVILDQLVDRSRTQIAINSGFGIK